MNHTLQDSVLEKENRVEELKSSLDKAMEDVARLTVKYVIKILKLGSQSGILISTYEIHLGSVFKCLF